MPETQMRSPLQSVSRVHSLALWPVPHCSAAHALKIEMKRRMVCTLQLHFWVWPFHVSPEQQPIGESDVCPAAAQQQYVPSKLMLQPESVGIAPPVQVYAFGEPGSAPHSGSIIEAREHIAGLPQGPMPGASESRQDVLHVGMPVSAHEMKSFLTCTVAASQPEMHLGKAPEPRQSATS
jgi:hypothetical protein